MDEITPNEPARQAAHVLLDVCSVWNVGDDSTASMADLALSRLDDTGAVRIVSDGEGTDRAEVSDLVGAAVVLILHLAERLALASETDRHEVISETRAVVDTCWSSPGPNG